MELYKLAKDASWSEWSAFTLAALVLMLVPILSITKKSRQKLPVLRGAQSSKSNCLPLLRKRFT
jgi:hypothetical protein